MDKLTPEQITEQMTSHASWTLQNDQIQRTFSFEDFIAAMRFVNDVATHAERVQHHPDILIRWNKVTLTLSTHDAGGLTEKDFAFASAAEAMLTPVALGAPKNG